MSRSSPCRPPRPGISDGRANFVRNNSLPITNLRDFGDALLEAVRTRRATTDLSNHHETAFYGCSTRSRDAEVEDIRCTPSSPFDSSSPFAGPVPISAPHSRLALCSSSNTPPTPRAASEATLPYATVPANKPEVMPHELQACPCDGDCDANEPLVNEELRRVKHRHAAAGHAPGAMSLRSRRTARKLRKIAVNGGVSGGRGGGRPSGGGAAARGADSDGSADGGGGGGGGAAAEAMAVQRADGIGPDMYDMYLYGTLLQRLMSVSPGLRALPCTAWSDLDAVTGALSADLTAAAAATTAVKPDGGGGFNTADGAGMQPPAALGGRIPSPLATTVEDAAMHPAERSVIKQQTGSRSGAAAGAIGHAAQLAQELSYTCASPPAVASSATLGAPPLEPAVATQIPQGDPLYDTAADCNVAVQERLQAGQQTTPSSPALPSLLPAPPPPTPPAVPQTAAAASPATPRPLPPHTPAGPISPGIHRAARFTGPRPGSQSAGPPSSSPAASRWPPLPMTMSKRPLSPPRPPAPKHPLSPPQPQKRSLTPSSPPPKPTVRHRSMSGACDSAAAAYGSCAGGAPGAQARSSLLRRSLDTGIQLTQSSPPSSPLPSSSSSPSSSFAPPSPSAGPSPPLSSRMQHAAPWGARRAPVRASCSAATTTTTKATKITKTTTTTAGTTAAAAGAAWTAKAGGSLAASRRSTGGILDPPFRRRVMFGDDPAFQQARKLYDMNWKAAQEDTHANRWVRRVLCREVAEDPFLLAHAAAGANWTESAAASAAIANGTPPAAAAGAGGGGPYGSWCAPWRQAQCQERLVYAAVQGVAEFFASYGSYLGLSKLGPLTYGFDSRRLRLKILPDGRLAVRCGSGWEELTKALAKLPLPRRRPTGNGGTSASQQPQLSTLTWAA